MVSIDGTDISGVTIDGTDVQEITIDGTTAWERITWDPTAGMFVVAGYNSNTSSNSLPEGYQLQGSSWKQITEIPKGVLRARAVVDSSGNAYVLGGSPAYPNDPPVRNWKFNGSWSRIPESDGFSSETGDPLYRRDHDVVIDSNDRIYMVGGSIRWGVSSGDAEDSATDSVISWAPGEAGWQQEASLNHGRERHVAAIDSNDNIYAIGGFDYGSDYGEKIVEKYDGSSWTDIGEYPTRGNNTNRDVWYMSAAGDTSGNIWVAGARGPRSEVLKYDGSSWDTSIPDLQTARENPACVTDSQDNVYVVGGEDGNYNGLASIEKYDGSSWSYIKDMPQKKKWPSAVYYNG